MWRAARPHQREMPAKNPQIFLSYSGEDAFETSLLQYAIEQRLKDVSAKVWTYHRDQRTDQRNVGRSLKERVRQSVAVIFLVSPATLNSGATQWMELAYADAFGVPTFILLHRVTFDRIKSRKRGVPPYLLASHCTEAAKWDSVVRGIRSRIVNARKLQH